MIFGKKSFVKKECLTRYEIVPGEVIFLRKNPQRFLYVFKNPNVCALRIYLPIL